MTQGPNDDHLRRALTRLREEEARHTPPFSRLMDAALSGHRRRREVRGWRLGLAAAAVLVLVTLGVWRGPRVRGHDDRLHEHLARWEQFSAGTWVAPTDFLLCTPARDLLERVPDLGVRRKGWYPLDETNREPGRARTWQRRDT